MPHDICATCASQHAETALPPEHCDICEDERQYVGRDGQRWTTLGELRAAHHVELRPEGPGPTGVAKAAVARSVHRYLRAIAG